MTTRVGCYACVHGVRRFGEWDCLRQPHRYETSEQRAIVLWLQRTSKPHNSAGCPSFELDAAFKKEKP